MARKMIFAASLGLLLAGCASLSSPPVASSTGAREAVAQGRDKDVVCVQQHTTGSHLAQVVCTTKEERARAMANDRRDYTNMTAPNLGGQQTNCKPHCL
jgi:hypothetical protein